MKKSELVKMIHEELEQILTKRKVGPNSFDHWKKEAEKYTFNPNAASRGFSEPNPFPKGSFEYWEREALNTKNEPHIRDNARNRAWKLRSDINLEERK